MKLREGIKEGAERIRKKKLAEFVLRELERRSTERAEKELQWRLNICFEKGDQYCDAVWPAGEIYRQEKQYYWQEREVFNHIAPIIEARLARLSQVRPLMMVRPASGDDSDRQNAQLCTNLLHSVYYKLDMQEKLKQATQWSELCGSAFYKVTWDAEAECGGVRCGDISVTVCPAFEIYPDSCASPGVDRCRSIIHSVEMPCEEIFDRYGVRAKPEKGARVLCGSGAPAREDCAIVAEYYEVPSEEYKNGRMLTVAGGELVYEGELPYRNGEDGARCLPFIRQCAVPDPTGFFGTSVIQRCIPVQRAYNAVKNRKHEYLDRAAFGVIAVEEGAMDMQSLEQDGLCPGKILVYRAGSTPPQMMPVGQLPNEFTREETQLLQEFEMISGVSEMMRRSYSGAATSGVALSLLNDQDNTRLAVTSESIRDAAKEMAKMWLRLYRQYATQPRLMQIAGDNGSVELACFNASMLTSDDVVHETENELSQSVTQRRQMLFDLMARGVFGASGAVEPKEKPRLLAALGLGDWENVDDLPELQAKAAQRENEGIVPAEIGEADDHDIHMAGHARFMLSERFEKLEREQPERAAVIKAHYAAHREAIENGN